MSGTNIVPSIRPANNPPANNKLTLRIFWTVSIAVALIALGSFTLSFLALYDLAIRQGIPPTLGWIWPLIVDLSMVIYTTTILVAQLQGWGARLPIGLTIFYATVTVIGNLLHAPATPLGWFVAALPPLSLILGTECLRVMAKHVIERQAIIASLDDLNSHRSSLETTLTSQRSTLERLTEQVTTLTSHRETLRVEIQELRLQGQASNIGQISPTVDQMNAIRLAKKAEAMDALLAYLVSNPHASLTTAGQAIGRSKTTIGNYVDELTAAGKLYRNGDGWQVSSLGEETK